ncbi:hypothetical protein BH23CHL5_BH23CHL5_05970 [soil metagenome]
MPDRYESVQELMREHRGEVEIVALTLGRTDIAVLAPHAGGIEPLSGELAAAIAGSEHRLYLFAGAAPANNADLHVTSTRFDEDRLRGVLVGARTAVAVHGATGGDEAVTQIGGRNTELGERIAAALEHGGFAVLPAIDRLAAVSPTNLVNRVPDGGVQLEISLGLRRSFLRGRLSSRQDRANPRLRTPAFTRYVDTVCSVLDQSAPEERGGFWGWRRG